MTGIRDLPPGHWVVAHLPDGRTAIAPHNDPIVAAMRRIHKAGLTTPRTRFPGTLQDYAAITDWLDQQQPETGQIPLWRAAA